MQQHGELTILKMGADVEEFLIDAEGKPVPCIELVGGTKEHPRPILTGNGFAIQEDNVMLEYNIPPAADQYQFVFNLMRVQEGIVEEVKKLGLRPHIAASMRFDVKQLEHPQARTAGCEPDFCAWEKRVNDPVKLHDEIRAAGAHLHISFLVGDKVPTFPEYLTEIESVIMALDIWLGCPSVLLDTDTERKKYYGRAGAFRAKPYGIEYRVMSNWWTKEPKYMGWVFENACMAIHQINYWGDTAHQRLMKYKDVVQKAINNNDVAMAKTMMAQFAIKAP